MPSRSRSYWLGELEQLPSIAEIDSRVHRTYVGLDFFDLPRNIYITLHSAHAALSPWEGKNALDAAVLGYNNISALRQQLKPTHRVHGIFEGKDWAPNSRSIEKSPSHLSNLSLLVIPDYAKFMSVAFISYIIKKTIIECTDVMYARPHVQKCKRLLNELLHALSKSSVRV